jgi:hypothetical protein
MDGSALWPRGELRATDREAEQKLWSTRFEATSINKSIIECKGSSHVTVQGAGDVDWRIVPPTSMIDWRQTDG